MINTLTETRADHRVFAGHDAAHTATAASGIAAETPALTPLMLDAATGKMIAWDGQAAGTAVGVLTLALSGTETHLTYYKTGTFATESLIWPDEVDEAKQTNAFVGSAISHA